MKKIILGLWANLTFVAIAFAHEGHEHVATNLLQIKWGLQGARELINIHPLFVHFPIALLLACVFLYVMGMILKKENLLIAGKWSLYLGTLSAALAVWTGLHAEETVQHGGDTHQILMAHQYLGIGILVLSALLSLWIIFSKANVPARGRAFFMVALLTLAAVLMQQADLGGRMVFLNGVGVGKKSMMQEQTHDHETMDTNGDQGHHH